MNEMAAMSGSIAEAEAYLRERFAGMNEEFFSGRLPCYAICVQADAVITPGGRGHHDRRKRRITVLLMERSGMEGTLVHELAHAATNDHHGPRWTNEMRRLFRCGAPLADLDLRRLCLRTCDGVQSQSSHDSWGW